MALLGTPGRVIVVGVSKRQFLWFATAGTMSRLSVPCHVKGAVALQVGDARTFQGRPGVLVIDVTFPSIEPFEVSKPGGRDGALGRGNGEFGRCPGV